MASIRTVRSARDTGRPSRYNSGGVRAFRKLLRRINASERVHVCDALTDTAEELFDQLGDAVKARDIKVIDAITEELKVLEGSSEACRITRK